MKARQGEEDKGWEVHRPHNSRPVALIEAEQTVRVGKQYNRAGITVHSAVLAVGTKPDKPAVVEIRALRLSGAAADQAVAPEVSVGVAAAVEGCPAAEVDPVVGEVGLAVAAEVDADEQHISTIPFFNGGEANVTKYSQ